MANNTNDSGIYKTGDIVVGSPDPNTPVYSATGAKLIQDGSTLYGDPALLQARQTEITTSALRHGGKILRTSTAEPLTKRRGRPATKNKATPQSYPTFYNAHNDVLPESANIPQKLITIQFENEFGKMKAKVEHIVEQDLAYLLIFTNDDAVVFEPKVGETLTLHTPNNCSNPVYYPGVTFDSPDSGKKFMILFKVPAEDQE